MSKVELAFDAIRAELERRNIESWKPSDRDLLCSFISAYYAQKCAPQIHDDAITCAGVDHVLYEKVAEVDRGLSRIRNYLNKKYPFETLPELCPGASSAVQKSTRGIEELPHEKGGVNTRRAEQAGEEVDERACGSESNAKTVALAAPALSLRPRAEDGLRHGPPSYVVDAFLYSEDAIDELVTDGRIPREYCRSCGSLDVGLVDYVTHSFSQDQLVYLSCFLVPALAAYLPAFTRRARVLSGCADNIPAVTVASAHSTPQTGIGVEMEKVDPPAEAISTTIVDVGSRLGIVLWSMYLAASAGVYDTHLHLAAHAAEGVGCGHVSLRALGIEVDPKFSLIQREIQRRYCPRPIPLPSKPPIASAEGLGRTEHEVATAQKDSLSTSAPVSFFVCDVIESDCFQGEGAVALGAADIVVLHNVFEFFCEHPKEHLASWEKLRALVKRPGQLLICCPSLETFGKIADSAPSECDGRRSGSAMNAGNNDISTWPAEAVSVCASVLEGKAHGNSQRKRCRSNGSVAKEGEEGDVAESVSEVALPTAPRDWRKNWIDSYVERIHVDAVAQRFIKFRAASAPLSCEGHCCPDGLHKSHAALGESFPNGCALDTPRHGAALDLLDDGVPSSSSSEVMHSELEEQICSIFVYRVK